MVSRSLAATPAPKERSSERSSNWNAEAADPIGTLDIQTHTYQQDKGRIPLLR